MDDNSITPAENRNSKSFKPWSASFNSSTEKANGYQQFDHDNVEAREYQQELENQRQQQQQEQEQSQTNLPSKKPNTTINVTELSQQHTQDDQPFKRADFPQYPLLSKPSGWAIFWREWWLESVACLLVVISLAAIVGIIWYHNGQPLPNWKHGITINSLMSIFLVIMKSGMGLVLAQGLAHLKWTWFDNARPLQDLETYDKAAHGPLGAAMLLLTVRNRHTITAIGAIVTIAALGIDPMVQGLVKYYDCAWPVAALSATIPHAQTFSEGGKHVAAGLSQLPLPQQAAISSGLYTPGQLAMQFDCPSGNCTFAQTYSSVGYCSSCEDVSHRIVMANHTERVPTSDGSPDPTTGLNYTMNNYTSYTLPISGISTSNSLVNGTYLTMGSPDSLLGTVVLLAGTPGNNMFYLAPGTSCKAPISPANSWGCRGYGAMSCSLLPCVQSFNGSISGGTLSEKPIARSNNWGVGEGVSQYTSMLDMSCVNDTERASLRKEGYTFTNTTRFLPYLQSFDPYTGDWQPLSYDNNNNPVFSPATKLVRRKCLYQADGITINSLNTYWPTLFTSNLSTDPFANYGNTAISMADVFWNSGAITPLTVASYFENVTEALTTHIRLLSDASLFQPDTSGVVLRNVTCVRVRWPFLIFPAVCIVAMLAFFVGMALETRNRVGVAAIDHKFKSSPLALMVHGLDGEVQEKLASTPVVGPGEHGGGGGGEKGGVKGLWRANTAPEPGREQAKKVIVRLSPTEHGLRFVTQDRETE